GLLAQWPGHLRGRAHHRGSGAVPAVPDPVAGDHRAEYLAGRQRRRLPGPEVGLAGQAAGRDRARAGRLHGVPALGLPALSRSWSTGCSGSACTVPRWPWTVWARNIELRTASSVASATAWNKGVMASLDSRCSSWRGRAASRRTDFAVLKAITYSPEPFDIVEPVRPRPIRARAARRSRPRAASGAPGRTTNMSQPSPAC